MRDKKFFFPIYESIVPLSVLTFLTGTYTTKLRNNAPSLLQFCGYYCPSDRGKCILFVFESAMFTTTLVYQFFKRLSVASEFEFLFLRIRLTLVVCKKHTCHLVGWFVLACMAYFLQNFNRICWYSFPISDIQSQNRCIEQNLNLYDTVAKNRPPLLLWSELKSILVWNQTTKSVSVIPILLQPLKSSEWIQGLSGTLNCTSRVCKNQVTFKRKAQEQYSFVCSVVVCDLLSRNWMKQKANLLYSS